VLFTSSCSRVWVITFSSTQLGRLSDSLAPVAKPFGNPSNERALQIQVRWSPSRWGFRLLRNLRIDSEGNPFRRVLPLIALLRTRLMSRLHGGVRGLRRLPTPARTETFVTTESSGTSSTVMRSRKTALSTPSSGPGSILRRVLCIP
jgi:hypothetical protein